jgi:hypothetical protein
MYSLGGREVDGYVPSGLNIGHGDYISFHYCLDCGQIQGEFPIPEENTLEVFPDEEECLKCGDLLAYSELDERGLCPKCEKKNRDNGGD